MGCVENNRHFWIASIVLTVIILLAVLVLFIQKITGKEDKWDPWVSYSMYIIITVLSIVILCFALTCVLSKEDVKSAASRLWGKIRTKPAAPEQDLGTELQVMAAAAEVSGVKPQTTVTKGPGTPRTVQDLGPKNCHCRDGSSCYYDLPIEGQKPKA